MLATDCLNNAADNRTQLFSPALAAYRRQDPLQHLSGSGKELGCAGAQINSFLLLYSSLGLPLFLLSISLVELHKLPQHSNSSWSVSSVLLHFFFHCAYSTGNFKSLLQMNKIRGA